MFILFVLKGLVPSNDLQQAVADMFSEGVYDLENEIIRAIVHPNQEQQVVYLQILYGVWPLQIFIQNSKKKGYSGSSRKLPPRELRKVVAARVGRLQ